MIELFFPPETRLVIEDVKVQIEQINIYANDGKLLPKGLAAVVAATRRRWLIARVTLFSDQPVASRRASFSACVKIATHKVE